MKKTFKLLTLSAILSSLVFGNFVLAQMSDVDTQTSTNACFSISGDLRKGSRDSNFAGEVTKLQEALMQLGLLNQDPTGYFGTATYNAVVNFQSSRGLATTGFVGSYTRAAIQSATCNNQTQNTSYNPTIVNATYCPTDTYLNPNSNCQCPNYYLKVSSIYNNQSVFKCNYSKDTACQTGTLVFTSSGCNCPAGYYPEYVNSNNLSFICKYGTPASNICPISYNVNVFYNSTCVCPIGYIKVSVGGGYKCNYNGPSYSTVANNTQVCSDGSVVSIYASCPYNTQYQNNYQVGQNYNINQMYTCSNGAVVSIYQPCPSY